MSNFVQLRANCIAVVCRDGVLHPQTDPDSEKAHLYIAVKSYMTIQGYSAIELWL